MTLKLSSLVFSFPTTLSRHHCLLLSVALVFTAASCSASSANREVSGPAAALQTTSHEATGLVKSVNAEPPSIAIQHEEINGLMPAMTMDFHVKDKSLLQGLQAGDHVEFTVESGVGGLKITRVKKL